MCIREIPGLLADTTFMQLFDSPKKMYDID